MRVYHLGHSLVGRDMPAMLAQLAGAGPSSTSQLGWVTSLDQHLAGPAAINGFAVENAGGQFRLLAEALADPGLDVLVVTEMIGLKAAIRYRDTERAIARLARDALARNPGLRLYLYENWHPLDEDDLLAQVDELWQTLRQPKVLASTVRAANSAVGVIPAGAVMARLVAEVEAAPGGVGGMTRREDLFSKNPEGEQDMIHLNDLGNYLVALTHYAVLYGRDPAGLQYRFLRADGTPAVAPSAELAAAMHRIVWQVVQFSPLYR